MCVAARLRNPVVVCMSRVFVSFCDRTVYAQLKHEHTNDTTTTTTAAHIRHRAFGSAANLYTWAGAIVGNRGR